MLGIMSSVKEKEKKRVRTHTHTIVNYLISKTKRKPARPEFSLFFW